MVLFTLIFSSYGLKTQLADSPWPTFHSNPQRTGLSLYNTSHVDGTVLWTYQTGNAIESSPAIGEDGTIYVGSHDGYLYAISKNGELEWKTKLGTPITKEHCPSSPQSSTCRCEECELTKSEKISWP